MASKDVIGHIDCPVCGHEMPVKADKNGHAYAHCAHSCNAQVFARNDHRDSLLRQRMRPVTVSVTEPVAKKVDPVTVSVTEPDAKKVEPVTVPVSVPSAPKATPPKERANWFSPVLGVKHGRA